jgi:hypothetical protein
LHWNHSRVKFHVNKLKFVVVYLRIHHLNLSDSRIGPEADSIYRAALSLIQFKAELDLLLNSLPLKLKAARLWVGSHATVAMLLLLLLRYIWGDERVEWIRLFLAPLPACLLRADGRMERLLAADELFSFGAQISASRAARTRLLHFTLSDWNKYQQQQQGACGWSREEDSLISICARPNELLTLFTPAEINPALRPCLPAWIYFYFLCCVKRKTNTIDARISDVYRLKRLQLCDCQPNSSLQQTGQHSTWELKGILT